MPPFSAPSTESAQATELLAPAGDWSALRAAVAHGADAVYFGLSNFNARHRATNFTLDELPDVVAFYLTAAFDDEKWAIHEYARVRGHELVRRVDLLPDEPHHPRARATYYKLQLEPLQRLPRPILSLRWRRITFIQTSGDRLMHALEISDLIEKPSSRFVTLMDSPDDD